MEVATRQVDVKVISLVIFLAVNSALQDLNLLKEAFVLKIIVPNILPIILAKLVYQDIIFTTLNVSTIHHFVPQETPFKDVWHAKLDTSQLLGFAKNFLTSVVHFTQILHVNNVFLAIHSIKTTAILAYKIVL